jgi:hypothetical protein
MYSVTSGAILFSIAVSKDHPSMMVVSLCNPSNPNNQAASVLPSPNEIKLRTKRMLIA